MLAELFTHVQKTFSQVFQGFPGQNTQSLPGVPAVDQSEQQGTWNPRHQGHSLGMQQEQLPQAWSASSCCFHSCFTSLQIHPKHCCRPKSRFTGDSQTLCTSANDHVQKALNMCKSNQNVGQTIAQFSW